MTIYLDHAASTPVDPRVAAVMCEWLATPAAQANPASATHGLGLAAGERVEQARREVAALIGAAPPEVIFTSGATEANNLALLGVAAAARRAARANPGTAAGGPGHFISSRVEHKSVLDPLRQIERDGFDVTWLEPDEHGRVPPEAVRTALRADTLLVSLMLVNNEIGAINDIAAVAALLTDHGALLHTDAAQAVGKLPVRVGDLRVDLLSLTAHKFYGPKGIGALYVRERARSRLAPILFGGGHERGLRSGTLPTHQVVGLGAAASLVAQGLAQDAAHVRDLARRLCRELETIPGVEFNSSAQGVPGLVNASFRGVEGESLVTGLPGLALSTGSACSSATREPSYVLRALGRDTELAQSSLRISLGRFTTAAEIDAAATAIRDEVARLRALAGEPAGSATGAEPEAGSLMARTLNEMTRRYFRAPARPPRFAQGAGPSGIRHGRAGKQEQGACVLFELEIDGAFVKSARFSAYGCPHTVAVTAWLCETLEGVPLEMPPTSPK
ncbi:MAG TPA: aminotransferase class V-fold PLP-dependent enzyme, partial [Steroidobacteraceae bacterium]|nr:aminotransferase class V-fold PLP-dependent enzyme [Steroidobacteraceae bacterium]